MSDSIDRASNKRLERTHHERASLVSCVGEPLKRRRWAASVDSNREMKSTSSTAGVASTRLKCLVFYANRVLPYLKRVAGEFDRIHLVRAPLSFEKKFPHRCCQLANTIIVACLSLSVVGCDVSEQAINMNIEQLKAAEANLLKNPHDKEALSFVLNQLNDWRGIYRANAAAVLEHVGEKVGGSISGEAVPALSNLLNKGDDSDKRAAAGALRSFGPYAAPALPVLRKGLIPSNRDVAWFSATAIGNIGADGVEAVPDLLTAIKGNTETCEGYFSSFCESFIPALGKIGSSARSAVPDLEALLNHRDPYVRMRLAVALIRIDSDNQKGLEELGRLLQNPDVEIRRRSLVVLKECGKDGKPAVHLIEKAIKDSDDDVRREAADLLRLLIN